MTRPTTIEQGIAEAGRKARLVSAIDTVAILDALSRKRALTDEESRRLERAIYLADHAPQKERFYWTVQMDRKLMDMRQRGVKFAEIAAELGVTAKSAEIRMSRLRKMGEAPQ